MSNFEPYKYRIWLVFLCETNHPTGFAGFLHLEEAFPSLIYGIDPDFWGNGYGTESARAVLNYTVELKFPKVIAEVDKPNIASVRVLEKLGMKQTEPAVVQGKPLLYFEDNHLEQPT